jgi:hypothetical protein
MARALTGGSLLFSAASITDHSERADGFSLEGRSSIDAETRRPGALVALWLAMAERRFEQLPL